MKKIMTVLLLATALPTLAVETAKTATPSYEGPATMCNDTYALCIMAPCIKQQPGQLAPCECVIQTGWNMGPDTCDHRDKNLTSTYSNNFNNCNLLLSCPAPTDWAWCYGASCSPDPKNPSKFAICQCPVFTSGTIILVKPENCMKGNAPCRQLWSGAMPAESQFANWHYYDWMTSHGYPTNPPAGTCPVEPEKPAMPAK